MQRIWGRKISDLGHSQFVDILKHQASKVGTNVVEIPRFYPSSKTCSCCAYVLDELPLSARAWFALPAVLSMTGAGMLPIIFSRLGHQPCKERLCKT